MSKQTISDKTTVIRNETGSKQNTAGRIADVLDDINESKLDVVNRSISVGNINADSLQDATGDATFTKQVVAKADGTFGSSNIVPETLASVMNRGNYAPKPIYFVNGDEEYTSLGMNQATYSMFWGNMNRNHTGDVNISMGYDSMGGLTTGTANSAYAVGALNLLTTGSRNTAIGQSALNKVSVNSDNTAVGQASLYNATGFKNTAVGVNTGTSLTSGSLNVLLGYKANNTSNFGDRNIFIGPYSAPGVTGSNNIIIGASAGYGDGAISNKLIIHSNHTATGYSNTSDGTLGTPTLGSLSNALISGDFSAKTLSFNSTLQVKLLPNADGDATYTKQVVAKPDGTFGLVTPTGGSYIPLSGTAAGSPVTGDVQLTGGRLYSGTIGGNYSKLQATSSYIQLQAYSGMTSAFVMVQPDYIGIWGNSVGGVRIEVSPTGILMGGLGTIINDYSYNKRPVLNSSGEVKLITEPKKYVASMRSNGTTAGFVVFENTIGAIVWTRTNVGEYQGVLSGAFTADKVAIFAQCAQSNGGTGYPLNIIAGRIDANTVYIKVTRTDNGATPFEFTGEVGSLEIRVYN